MSDFEPLSARIGNKIFALETNLHTLQRRMAKTGMLLTLCDGDTLDACFRSVEELKVLRMEMAKKDQPSEQDEIESQIRDIDTLIMINSGHPLSEGFRKERAELVIKLAKVQGAQ
jgi:hypothetical protein